MIVPADHQQAPQAIIVRACGCRYYHHPSPKVWQALVWEWCPLKYCEDHGWQMYQAGDLDVPF